MTDYIAERVFASNDDWTLKYEKRGEAVSLGWRRLGFGIEVHFGKHWIVGIRFATWLISYGWMVAKCELLQIATALPREGFEDGQKPQTLTEGPVRPVADSQSEKKHG